MTCTGKVTQVKITQVTQSDISFTTDSRPVGATAGYAPVLGTYNCRRTDVFLPTTPTTPDGIPMEPSVELAEGKKGPLYLEPASLFAQGRSTTDGGACTIRGAVHDPVDVLPGESFILLKWPDCGGAGDSHETLELVPDRISVTGFAPGKQPATVNLFDATLALPTQDIVWRGCEGITLQLTSKGFQKFHAPVANDAHLTIWPTKIEIFGKPTSGGFHNKIDIRDRTLAWPGSRLTWNTPGNAIRIEATSLGFEAFGLSTESLRRAARVIHALAQSHKDLLPAITTLLSAHELLMRSRQPLSLHGGDEIVRDVMMRLSGHRAE